MEVVKKRCSNCPFAKATPLHLPIVENLVRIEKDKNRKHTCHKTDPRAEGFLESYTGEVKGCAGFETFESGGDDEIYSLSELQRAYSPARRKWKRFETHKLYHAKQLGAPSAYDAMLNYETSGAFYMNMTQWPAFDRFIDKYKMMQN